MRGLTDNFVNQLQYGLLTQILIAVKSDSTLCLEIRENYINIYYRGGNVIKIQENNGAFVASFDRKYLNRDLTKVPELPSILNEPADIEAWISALPYLKHEMDMWFGCHSKDEREFQQLMVRENNSGNSAIGTDYFICDIEYANHTGRFDLIAVKWPSSSIHRKNNSNLGLAFIEMKYLDNALTGSAGLCKHIEDIIIFLRKSEVLDSIKKEMKIIFNQKLELGLINNQKPISSFNDEKPEFILALINHDPASSILKNELKRIPDCPNAEIKVATSNFMGYGLYSQCIYSLNEFLNKFKGNI